MDHLLSVENNAIADTVVLFYEPLESVDDLQDLINKVKDARVVMLGESSHGTHEFYQWRKTISQILISLHGFNFIGVEGDWPPCSEVNLFVQGKSSARNAQEALSSFQRWPTWMWNNTDVDELMQWMRQHNLHLEPGSKPVGFFGLDVYSLFESMEQAERQLRKLDPKAADMLKDFYSCFESYAADEKKYLRSLYEFPMGCRKEVAQALQLTLSHRLSNGGAEILFDAQQNARIVRNAENYYQAMMDFNDESWNVRDRHMLEMLEIMLNHYGPKSKAIVWAHNTHIGDYRATDMLQAGLVNIGGLAREKWGHKDVALVGFGTYQGKVTASHKWDGPIQTMLVPHGTNESYEGIFHQVCMEEGHEKFILDLNEAELKEALGKKKGHRAIGVVYDPGHERGNYVPTKLSERYDHFIFIDKTTALKPYPGKFKEHELPETWPGGF